MDFMILYHPLGKGFWKVVKHGFYDSLSSSWERFLEGCKTGIINLYHPLGKGFWKVVKQEYCDPLSSSWEGLYNRNIVILYFLKNISFSENCLQQNLCFVANYHPLGKGFWKLIDRGRIVE